MENSLERERRSKYDLIETADISYGHNKLLSYAICSLDCKNCNNYITTAYLPLRLKEEISCFNHFYKTQKHPAQTLWLPLPQYFSSTCLIRLPLWLTATFKEKKKKTIRRGSTVFLAMPKNLKMHCVSSILALLGRERRMCCAWTARRGSTSVFLNCVQASNSGKGDIWLRSVSHTTGKSTVQLMEQGMGRRWVNGFKPELTEMLPEDK